MSTHPPLFTALTRRLSPRHPVSVLARKIAHREDRLLANINRITETYYPRGWSDHHGKDD